MLYAPSDPVTALSDAEKVTLLERLERIARARDSRVTQVMASLAGEYEAILIARSDGLIAADVRPLVRLSLSVIVEEGGKREQGMGGGGGRVDYGYFTESMLQRVRQAGGRAGAAQPQGAAGARRHDDRRARTGLAGHPAARGDRSRPGGRLQPQGNVGVLRAASDERVAAKGVTVVDDGTIAQTPRLAQHRRRGQSDAAHGADRGRHPAGLHAGHLERAR